MKWMPGMRDREGPDLSLTFQPRKGWELWNRAAQDPLPRMPAAPVTLLTFYQGPLPLPHLAIYCCNLLTSKMLHNRPHLGQGEFPGSAPPLGGAPWGQVLRGTPCTHPSLISFRSPRLGSIHPICKYLRRDGVYLFHLIGTGRGITTSSMPFPEQGRDARIALLYWSPYCHSSH